MAVHLPSLICTPTAPHPDACPPLPPPQLSALYSSPTPWPWALLEAPLVTLSTLHPSQLHFHCGLFTCLLYWSALCCLLGDLSPVHGAVLVNLEIDLFHWDGSDKACCTNKRKMPFGLHLISHFVSEGADVICSWGIFFSQNHKKSDVTYPLGVKEYAFKVL